MEIEIRMIKKQIDSALMKRELEYQGGRENKPTQTDGDAIENDRQASKLY